MVAARRVSSSAVGRNGVVDWPKFIDALKGLNKAAARLARFDGAYLRFAGELRMKHYRASIWYRSTGMTRRGT